MPRDVARATLYRGTINLWVEDELTRAYLSEVWSDPGIAYFIAGGNEGVRAIVRDAQEAGYLNVFGLIDRDFGRTNKAGWNDPNKSFNTFLLPVHEIENFLLDSSALFGCRFNNVPRTQREIEDLMNKEASRRRSWAACRDVVALLRNRFRDRFIKDPTVPPVDTEAEARSHICNSNWFRSFPRRAAVVNENRVHRILSRAHTEATRRLSDGTWRREFSGKEIFHHVASHIFDRTKIPSYAPTKTEFYADLAKDVAAWQVAHDTVPTDLADLLAALRQRISLISSPP